MSLTYFVVNFFLCYDEGPKYLTVTRLYVEIVNRSSTVQTKSGVNDERDSVL